MNGLILLTRKGCQKLKDESLSLEQMIEKSGPIFANNLTNLAIQNKIKEIIEIEIKEADSPN